ncbi:MAG: hypothetical protein AAF591_14700 [Verrucomicrobiota bacterium]
MKTKSPLTLALLLTGFALAAALTTPIPATAQDGSPPGGDEEDSDDDGTQGFWECQSPGGTFVVRVNDITSVSKHTYVVDGAARVYELTVGTRGPVIARFYYIEAVTEESPLAIGKLALDRLKSLGEKTTERTDTEEVWTEVVKNYPSTTHAKTSEYRLDNVEALQVIYDHLYKVWALQKGRGKDNKVIVN